ncbi:MAG: hypothetical protein K2X35_13170 [Bryobacteraceae bacterium]|nr:hypothetical protein [Bryobacteraceae bacterium]
MLKTSVKKQLETDLEAAERLTATLRDVPFLASATLERESMRGNPRISFALSVRSTDSKKLINRRLVCAVRTSGQPRIAREACLNMADYLRANKRDYPVFIAPYITPAAAAICEKYDVGFLDFAGNCRLAFGRVFIRKEGFPNPASLKRVLRSLYSPKAERVVRVLLNAGPRNWRMQELAQEARVSLGQVANVKTLLLDREWIECHAQGFRLRSWEEAVMPLLNEWAANYRVSRNRAANFYSMLPIPEIEAALSSRPGVALTGFSGAARRIPVVRYQRVTAYMQGDISLAARTLDLKPVDSGANVTLLEPYDEGVFYGAGVFGPRPREVMASAVSPVQLYLDLVSLKGRGEEAASALLKEAIAPLWGVGWGESDDLS